MRPDPQGEGITTDPGARAVQVQGRTVGGDENYVREDDQRDNSVGR
ncbi:MAG: hypothetical protein OSB00_18180 [Sphingomonas bacterium]|nr:hypothetical protein [Sphingomonas bacterium]